MLDYALLGWLEDQPRTGYQLNQLIGGSTGFFWHARLSQIYTTLKRLEADGSVVSTIEPQDDRPDRRVYSITDRGRAALQVWLDTPITEMDQRKELLLLKLFFSSHADWDTLLASLRVLRTQHAAQLDRYRTEIKPYLDSLQANPDTALKGVFYEFTRDFGERFESMYVAWLDDTIARIESVKARHHQIESARKDSDG